MARQVHQVAGRFCKVAIAAILLTVVSTAESRALTPDQLALVQLANVRVTGQAGSDQTFVTRMAISGSYALVDYTDKANTGGELLASKSSGSWQTVKSGAGQAAASDLTALV